MLGGARRRWLALAVALLLATGSLAGCIGTGDEAEDVEAADAETASSTNASTNATDDDPANETDETVEFETETTTFEGSGTGIGASATGSNFWIVSQGFSQDFTPPERFENGTLTLEWDGLESQGGMIVWLLDGDQQTVHVFHAPSSPYEAPLEPDDERVEGAAEILVLPDQGTPATAHVQVEWTGAFTFTVPAQAG